MTKIKFSEKMLLLAELFGVEMSKHRINIYFEILKKYPDEQLEKAFETACKTCKFFPKPVELIEIIEGNLADKSLLAWEKVKEAIEKEGVYRSVSFDDPLIPFVIERLGGWPKIFEIEGSLNWYQKDFEKLYQLYLKQGINIGAPKKLKGLIELDSEKYFPHPEDKKSLTRNEKIFDKNNKKYLTKEQK